MVFADRTSSTLGCTRGGKLAGSALDTGSCIVNIADLASRADRALEFVDRCTAVTATVEDRTFVVKLEATLVPSAFTSAVRGDTTSVKTTVAFLGANLRPWKDVTA